MVKYHPDARFLTDYAAGSLPASQALCVATHLHFCAGCRMRVGELTELGAELFMQQQPSPVDSAAFDQLLSRIAEQPAARKRAASAPAAGVASTLPRTLHRLAGANLEKVRWRRVGRKFRYANLDVGDGSRETSLLDIKAGGSVPQHSHGGDEITVLLKGSFSDQEGKYAAGDFIVRTRGETHRPVASQDQDCLCLATLDAPIVMRNWWLRLGLRLIGRHQHQAA